MKTTEELIDLLRDRTKGVGGQTRFAKEIGISPPYINLVLNGKVVMSKKIADALGYKKVIVFEKKD